MFTALNYQTVEQLYESDNSIIYRALREKDGQPVILKVLKALQPPPEVIARFKREYLLTKELALPGVIEAYGYLQTENHWVIVTENFGAASLRGLELAGQLSIEEFLDLAIELTEILAAIHDNVVIHKDINPSNIVLNPDTGVVKFIDFGISASKLAEETISFAHPTRLEGTPGYLAPEQTGRINRPLDYRSDLYSLGCTFYELLTGALPFTSDDLLELIHCHLARIPQAPHERRAEVPHSLSAIIHKLMAKDPDERYQSAHGLKVDLSTCRQRQPSDTPDAVVFDLGTGDVATHFRLPTKLYGRDDEIARLLASFEQVSSGATGLTLVAGYSGIGKSALVKELYGPITERRGFFVSGKFEQYQRNIPYAPVVDAFQALIQQLLCESERYIERWRDRLLESLGPSCAVLIEVIPQLELITGPMPPPPPLPPSDTQYRCARAMREFVRTFAQPEHPLVLFLDDLQWSDSASLNFLTAMTTADQIPYLFIIGAYRDNEVSPGHPLKMTLKDIAIAEYIQLAPLTPIHIAELLGDTFRAPIARTRALADLAHDKTGGNPFFIGEFLKALHADALIAFQHTSGTWEWDIEGIRTRDISDNVVELLIETLTKLPAETQSLLQWAACVGNRFTLHTMAIVSDRSVKQITDGLRPAIAEGFVVPLSGDYRLFEADVEDLEQRVAVTYKFAHDRIQQAAYTLIADADKNAMHLHLGRRLQQETPDALLEIVNQFNTAEGLVHDVDERLAIARLNQQAGEKAKDAAANESAFRFFTTGLAFLSPPAATADKAPAPVCADAAAYARDYELSLRLTEQATEAAYLTANFEAMEHLAESGLRHARSWEDKVEIYQVQINAMTAQSRLLDALDLAREILEPLGVSLPREPSEADIDEVIRQVDQALAGRSIASLVDLEYAQSTTTHDAAMRILDSIFMAVFLTAPSLVPIVAAQMVNLTLRHGRSSQSINGYIYYGKALCRRGHIETGYQFGLVARELVHRDQLKERMVDLYGLGSAYTFHWKEPFRDLLKDIKKASQFGFETGYIGSASNYLQGIVTCGFSAGFELATLDKYMHEATIVLKRLKQEIYLTWGQIYHQAALNLMGENDDPLILKGEAYDEEQQLPIHCKRNDLTTIFNVYYVKLDLYYRFQQYRQAITFYEDHLKKGNQPGSYYIPIITMLHSLSLLGICPEEEADQQESILQSVKENQEKMKTWASHGPANCSHRYHLVEAELARVLGDVNSAREHYDLAIDLACENQYLNDESLALERAAMFFYNCGRLRLAGYYVRDAYYAYQRWGARAKMLDLKRRYPDLLADPGGTATSRRGRSSTQTGRYSDDVSSVRGTQSTLATGELPDLDLETVLRASRAMSDEHDLTQLLKQVMRVCLENAGAHRGFLILTRGEELIVKVRGELGDTAEIQLLALSIEDRQDLAHSVVHYVAKTGDLVLLDNAAEEERFKNDPYLRTNVCQSLLCVPIVYQGILVGLVYMEDNQTTGAFKDERVEVLSLLMTQAAVSIENALLQNRDEGAEFHFTVGGSLSAETPSYVLRRADQLLHQRVQRSEFCYVFNARQMGKSSLRVHTMHQLSNAGVCCAAIDMTMIGSETVTLEQWYAGLPAPLFLA